MDLRNISCEKYLFIHSFIYLFIYLLFVYSSHVSVCFRHNCGPTFANKWIMKTHRENGNLNYVLACRSKVMLVSRKDWMINMKRYQPLPFFL